MNNIYGADENIKTSLKKTFEKIAMVVGSTLGPYGKNVLLQDHGTNHRFTKDGYSVLRKLYFTDDIDRTLLTLISDISRKLVRTVGDGSTSSILLAKAFYDEFIEKSSDFHENNIYIPPQDLLNIFSEIAKEVYELMKNQSTIINEQNLYKLKEIAEVSLNGNTEIAEMIYEMYKIVGKEGFINIDKSSSDKTFYKSIDGFEIYRGPISNYMIEDKHLEKTVLKDPYILMVNDRLTESDLDGLALIINAVMENSSSIVILAKDYDVVMQNFFNMNLVKNSYNIRNFPVIAVSIATDNKAEDKFNDIAANLGCKVFDKKNFMTMDEFMTAYPNIEIALGRSEEVIVTTKGTKFINPRSDKEKVEERLKIIDDKIKRLIDTESMYEIDSDLYELKKRKSLLLNQMVSIYVGGVSDAEKNANYDLVEDAVFACKSAYINGYNVGGNLAIYFSLLDNKEKLKKIIERSLKCKNIEVASEMIINGLINASRYPFYKVLNNSEMYSDDLINNIIDECYSTKQFFNLRTCNFESIDETRIINSIETDSEILKTAISIVGLLISTGFFISINPTNS